MDSLQVLPENRHTHFEVLTNIANLAYEVADLKFCAEEWIYILATDGPLQIDGHNCGVFALANLETLLCIRLVKHACI